MGVQRGAVVNVFRENQNGGQERGTLVLHLKLCHLRKIQGMTRHFQSVRLLVSYWIVLVTAIGFDTVQ